MGNTLYLECASGISGDMAVGALLDLGADPKVLGEVLNSLPVKGFEIEISRVKKAGLDACDFRVKLDQEHENHDHDMEYLHGHSHEYSHGHSREHSHDHSHERSGVSMEDSGVHKHSHEFTGSQHPHEHRSLSEIQRIIDISAAPLRAKQIAGRIFQILAEAEAKAHGVPTEQVHFHEVGAVDSIVDIIALAVCMDDLDITEVIVPELSEGRGFVRCQHGVIPVPVPAVVNIAAEYRIGLHLTEVEGELVTPTGAAFVAAVRTSDRLPEHFMIRKIGMGAGKRTYERPSLLRAMLIETTERETAEKEATERETAEQQTAELEAVEAETDHIYRLETNIDDCSGECLGNVMECLFKAGARDVHYTPVFMKKNRPAYQLTVICGKEAVPEMESIIFRETTTIGIRRIAMERTVLKRRFEKIQTALGAADVKICTLPDEETRCYPEYESTLKLAKAHGIAYQNAFRCIQEAAGAQEQMQYYEAPRTEEQPENVAAPGTEEQPESVAAPGTEEQSESVAAPGTEEQPEKYEEKRAKLKEQIRGYAEKTCMVAFSGGVDSSLLLKLVCEASGAAGRGKVYAVTMQTRLHPVGEIEHARTVAEEIGAVHIVLTVDELMEAGIENNPTDRCYLCKKHLFGKMKEKAEELSVDVILEGTNEDDLHVYRPGLKAIQELGIRSPLADAGFTKAEVRKLAYEYGLSVSDRPAVPCLATRFPYGTRLTYGELRKVELGEDWLKKLGFYNVRLRVHDSVARIEVDPEQLPLALQYRQEMISYIKGLGYLYVTLDLEGFRSGSMDIGENSAILP